MSLHGVSVLVAGAGLAGLVAARDLAAMGAEVTVVDARDRIGGRVRTVRDGFTGGQHAEAGGDMIDEDQREIRALAAELGLPLTRILRTGFGYARPDATGTPRIARHGPARGWARLATALREHTRLYRLADHRWDSPIATDMARRSVSMWLDDLGADDELRATATGMRGFFLADPEELSLLALVDQFASMEEASATWNMYRIQGGNDRMAAALAAPLGARVRLKTELVAISLRGKTVHASLNASGSVSPFTCDYLVVTLPASVLRRIPITPALPARQHDAIAELKYGRATKTLLQFSRRFWRRPGRPRAFGTALPIGALWEANEGQPGQAGILALLAGGSASTETRAIVAKSGIGRLADELAWLGPPRGDLVASTQVVWESDPWARGGYAFFDPSFDPDLRRWLAHPTDRLFFAGEHTSIRWQGYMNGAVESGHRAAAEVAAVHGPPPPRRAGVL